MVTDAEVSVPVLRVGQNHLVAVTHPLAVCYRLHELRDVSRPRAAGSSASPSITART
jgi:hypothetical protein